MQGNESRSLEVVKSDRKGLLWAGGGVGGRMCNLCMPAPLGRGNRDLDARIDGYGQRPGTCFETRMRVRGNLDVRGAACGCLRSEYQLEEGDAR